MGWFLPYNTRLLDGWTGRFEQSVVIHGHGTLGWRIRRGVTGFLSFSGELCSAALKAFVLFPRHTLTPLICSWLFLLLRLEKVWHPSFIFGEAGSVDHQEHCVHTKLVSTVACLSIPKLRSSCALITS